MSTTLWQKHWILERNSILLLVGILIVIAIGGLVEVIPLFYLKSTIETADGMRPYTPLELAGRNIYVSEGCYLCHSQMIRALRDEVERYGHYSLAAESEYDHPFQWGSKRNGPDLARVGGKYSDDWHRDHLNNRRSVVPGSIMPAYPWLFTTNLEYAHIAQDMKVQSDLGVPYSDAMIDNALADVRIVEIGGEQPGIGRHNRSRHHRARVLQMVAVPIVGIFAADPRQIGAVALRAPLKRMIVLALGGKRIMAVTLDLVAQRPDHLRMAQITAFADIDIAAGEFVRRIRPHAVCGFDGALQVEQRHHFDEAADCDHDQNADQQQDRIALDDAVFLPERG